MPCGIAVHGCLYVGIFTNRLGRVIQLDLPTIYWSFLNLVLHWSINLLLRKGNAPHIQVATPTNNYFSVQQGAQWSLIFPPFVFRDGTICEPLCWTQWSWICSTCHWGRNPGEIFLKFWTIFHDSCTSLVSLTPLIEFHSSDLS